MRRAVLAFAGLLLLASCGIPGPLSRPRPMWNQAEAEAADAARQARECRRQHRPCPASPPGNTEPSPNAPTQTPTTPAPTQQ